jgi:hypothetical protein
MLAGSTAHLNREGTPVSGRRVERLMRGEGLLGVVRGNTVQTSVDWVDHRRLRARWG